MTPEQEEACAKFWESSKANNISLETCRRVWQACLEANEIGEIPDGYFRIGEEVECRGAGGLWYSGKVGVVIGKTQVAVAENTQVRRKPAWKPQDGEAVLFCDDDNNGRAMAGFIRNGILYARGLMCADWEKREKVKPFDASKIGKLWNEI
jgi:hypothetical protein